MAHKSWVNDHDPSHIEELGEYLQKLEGPRGKSSPAFLYLRAVYTFLKDRDVDGAIIYLKKIRDKNNGLWNYNVAFLLAYKGNLESAIKHYRKAARYDIAAEVIAQVEDFICWIIREEPEKCQFNYCLGFFNWKVKGDKIRAKKDFTKFINTCDKKHFAKEREFAQKWLRELE